MGNQTARMNCPLHEGQKIKYLCTQKKCIEPLCQICSKIHRNQHQKLGFSPSLIPISNIVDKHEKYEKMNRKFIEKDSQVSIKQGEYIPTGFILKKLTRQYFTKRFQQNKSNNNNKQRQLSQRSNSFIETKDSRQYIRPLSLQNLTIQEDNKRIKMVKILEEHELYHKMENNKKVKARIQQFFKQNLVLNEGVVGKEFSHLYE